MARALDGQFARGALHGYNLNPQFKPTIRIHNLNPQFKSTIRIQKNINYINPATPDPQPKRRMILTRHMQNKPILCGGWSKWRDRDEKITSVFRSLAAQKDERQELERIVSNLDNLIIIKYKEQVVNGSKFQVNVRVGSQSLIISIYKPIPGNGEAQVTNVRKITDY